MAAFGNGLSGIGTDINTIFNDLTAQADNAINNATGYSPPGSIPGQIPTWAILAGVAVIIYLMVK